MLKGFLTTLALSTVNAAVLAGDGAFPVEMAGTVVYVEDGDTLTMLDSSKIRHVIRLTDMDAPESPKRNHGKPGQPFSRASGKSLSALAKGKNASAHCYEADRYNRLVCRVVVDGVDVSLEQIKLGYGWANSANKRYVRDSRAYLYEAEAKADRRGLWAAPHPIPPWIWRRQCWDDARCEGAGE